jgi:hypothetical protein
MGDRLVRAMTYVILAGAVVWMGSKAATRLWDPDIWWHLRLGNDLIAQRSLSAPAHWSSFATVPWVPTEPVPEVVAAYAQRGFGYAGLAWLYGFGAALVVVVVQVTNRREAAQLPATVATVLFLLPAYGSITPRPQLVSFVLLSVVLAAWLQTERDLKPRWWLIPLTFAWSLCHGFWFIGAAYGFLFVVGIALSRRADLRTLLRLAVVAVASFLVVLLNPIGPQVFEAPFRVNAIAPYITEWQRTPLLTAGPLGALLMVALTVVLWAVTRTRVSWVRVLVLASAVFWVWYAERLVTVGAVVAAPMLASALEALLARSRDEAPAEPTRGPTRRELGIMGGIVAAFLVVLAVVVPQTSAEPGQVPLALDADLDRLPAGTPVFNDYVMGAWIAWRHPDLDQYIDGLATPYSAEHYAQFHRAETASPGWYRVVRDSRAPVALVEQDGPLAHGLIGRGWQTVGSDAGFLLLRRPGSGVLE